MATGSVSPLELVPLQENMEAEEVNEHDAGTFVNQDLIDLGARVTDKKTPDDIISATNAAAFAVQTALTATEGTDQAQQAQGSDPAQLTEDGENGKETSNDDELTISPLGKIGGTLLEEYADLSDSDSYNQSIWEDVLDATKLVPAPNEFYRQYRKYMLKLLNPSARKYLSDNLNPEVNHLSRKGIQKNWCGLVECTGKDYKYITNLERFKDPTKELLLDWQTEDGSTFGQLLTYLTDMDRYDIIDDVKFMTLISNSAIQYDQEREALGRQREERRFQRIAKKRGITNVGDLRFAKHGQICAFIAYDQADSEFVKEMIYECEILQNIPLCTNVADLIDGDGDEMTAELIIKRCTRTMVIISKHFITENTPMYQYAIKIMDICTPSMICGGKVIPMKINNCVMPRNFNHLTDVDFTRCAERAWLWRKVTSTLKITSVKIPMIEQQRLRHLRLRADDRIDLRPGMKAEGYLPPTEFPPRMKTIPTGPRPDPIPGMLPYGNPERELLRRKPYLPEPEPTRKEKFAMKMQRFVNWFSR